MGCFAREGEEEIGGAPRGGDWRGKGKEEGISVRKVKLVRSVYIRNAQITI